MSYIARCIHFFSALFKGIAHAFKMIWKFSIDWPGQVYPILIITLINILIIFVFDVTDTIYSPLASMIIWVLIGFQMMSVRKSIIKNNKDRIKNDKERLQSFFTHNIPNGLIGEIRYLRPYKEKWYRSLYYKFRKITRLSLYVWDNLDGDGSYTKIPVNKEVFFHLSLMGCVDITDPKLCTKGLDYIKENS